MDEVDEGGQSFACVADEVDGHDPGVIVRKFRHVLVSADGSWRYRPEEIGADELEALRDVPRVSDLWVVLPSAFVQFARVAYRKRI